MPQIIYSMCALTALMCAWLLLRAYARNRVRTLLWAGLCFVALTVNNVLLVLDRMVIDSVDLSMLRLVTALVAVLLLVSGLIVDSDA